MTSELQAEVRRLRATGDRRGAIRGDVDPAALFDAGAIVPIIIRPPRWMRSADAVTAAALVDTGATRTVIDEAICTRLKLMAHRMAEATVCGGERSICHVYKVDAALVALDGDERPFAGLEVIGAALGRVDIQALIGRDILRLGRLTYDGRTGAVDLDFAGPVTPPR